MAIEISMKKLMSIDPGRTTGICLGTDDSHFSRSANSFEEICLEIATEEPDLVIMESAPIFGSPVQWLLVQSLENFCSKYGVESVQVSPSEWKPIARAKNWRSDKASNRHEQDAYKMMRYYIWISNRRQR